MACFAAACPGQARSEFVAKLSVAVTTHADGFLYTYTLTNPAENGNDGDDDLITSLGISVAANADLKHIETPSGFDVYYSSGDTSIIWSSTDWEPSLSPGESATFSFVSRLASGNVDFTATAFNQINNGGNLDNFFGTTLGPAVSAVPEPVSMIPMGVGLATLGGYSLSRRSKSDDPGPEPLEAP
jgi:hypothetical protein